MALPSCYPDLIVKKRQLQQSKNSLSKIWMNHLRLRPDDMQAADVEGDDFPGTDVAEVLATAWREKRQELSKLQKSRQFGKAKEVRRAFRVEVE